MAELKTKKTTASILFLILTLLLVGAACEKKTNSNANTTNTQSNKYRLDTDEMNINIAEEPSNTNATVNVNSATVRNTNSSKTAQRCEMYYHDNVPEQFCATCGNGVCENKETCVPVNTTTNGPILQSCGPLYCAEDCP